jgi:hypothetical protein
MSSRRSRFGRAGGNARSEVHSLGQTRVVGLDVADALADRPVGHRALIGDQQVRPQSVGIIHDADECHDETIMQLTRSMHGVNT